MEQIKNPNYWSWFRDKNTSENLKYLSLAKKKNMFSVPDIFAFVQILIFSFVASIVMCTARATRRDNRSNIQTFTSHSTLNIYGKEMKTEEVKGVRIRNEITRA